MENNFLHSSSSAWRKENFSSYSMPLQSDLSTDICIIGAGIAGLTAAYELVSAGKSVVVLDSKLLGGGETGNTTAHLSNALDDYYFQIEELHGLSYSKLAAQSHSAAIDYIEKIVRQHDIECDFKRVDGYLFSPDTFILNKELKAAHRAGLSQVSWVKENTPNVFFNEPALLFPEQGQFHPLKYLHSLAEIITLKGAKLFGLTPAVRLAQAGDKINVITEDNLTVTASHVVTAANAPFQGPLKLHAKLIPNRTYAIGILIKRNSLKPALYWDTAEPYHYVRLQPYNEECDLLIIGGEDHRVGCVPKHDPYVELEKWAKSYFPSFQTVKYRWSGQVLEPVDYLAYLGRHPQFKNVYLITGDSGHGMTHGTIGGLLVSDLIQGKTNPWSRLYHPSRFSLKAWKKTLKHNLAAGYSYLRYLFPSRRRKVDALPKGEGRIVQCGIKKRAIYKDETGKVHECAAVCPHLKSLLQWNPIEKSWDCPAHGSRFDVDGEVLNGPANKKLKCFSVECSD